MKIEKAKQFICDAILHYIAFLNDTNKNVDSVIHQKEITNDFDTSTIENGHEIFELLKKFSKGTSIEGKEGMAIKTASVFKHGFYAARVISEFRYSELCQKDKDKVEDNKADEDTDIISIVDGFLGLDKP